MIDKILKFLIPSKPECICEKIPLSIDDTIEISACWKKHNQERRMYAYRFWQYGVPVKDINGIPIQGASGRFVYTGDFGLHYYDNKWLTTKEFL